MKGKATICCISVSHQGLAHKFMLAGGHYIICQPQESSDPGLKGPHSL